MTTNPTDPPRERRNVFGEVAEQYDAARPGYPEQLVTDVLEFTGRAIDAAAPALEVGAGTGKATLAFAARGIPLTCLEPDPRMTAVLARNCAGFPQVTIATGDFESWRPDGRRFGLLYSAQAWHWIDPAARWSQARAALAPGGTIALFWNDWAVAEEDVRQELIAVHLRHLTELPPHTILETRPRESVMGDSSWVQEEMAADGGFTDITRHQYTTGHEFSTAGLIDLLTSLSTYRLAPEATREALFRDVARVVDAHGAAVRLRTTTGLFLGRTTGRPG